MRDGPADQAQDAATLLNMAAHLRTLATDVTEIERILVAAVQDPSLSVEQPEIMHLQKFDAIGQSLRDLSRLATALAVTGRSRDTALRTLVLERTRLLIDTPVDTLQSSSGTVDLF